MECIFCRIARHDLPAEILFENDNALGILDINPIHYGHALVIPKKHCTNFLDIPTSDLYDVLHATQVIAKALVKGLSLEGFNIFSNNGKIAGQSVFHFHMHVTPRYPNDNIQFLLELKSYEGRTMNEYAELIRNHIAKAEDNH
jgi:histidine triad (HIT) family protein